MTATSTFRYTRGRTRFEDETLTLDPELHAGHVVVPDREGAATWTITLPPATGSGNTYLICSPRHANRDCTVQCTGGDVMFGLAIYANGANVSTAGAGQCYYTAADTNTATFTDTGASGNNTQEGLWCEVADLAEGGWWIQAFMGATDGAPDPFSAA